MAAQKITDTKYFTSWRLLMVECFSGRRVDERNNLSKNQLQRSVWKHCQITNKLSGPIYDRFFFSNAEVITFTSHKSVFLKQNHLSMYLMCPPKMSVMGVRTKSAWRVMEVLFLGPTCSHSSSLPSSSLSAKSSSMPSWDSGPLGVGASGQWGKKTHKRKCTSDVCELGLEVWKFARFIAFEVLK